MLFDILLFSPYFSSAIDVRHRNYSRISFLEVSIHKYSILSEIRTEVNTSLNKLYLKNYIHTFAYIL